MSERGKKQRLSAQQTRDRLVLAGLDALALNGLSVGLDAISLDQAVQDAGVPRSSAYAALSNGEGSPQEVLQRAVLMEAVATRSETIDGLMAQVGEFVAAPPEGLSGRALFRELIRIGGNYHFDGLSDSRAWRIVYAIRAIVNTGAPATQDAELIAWLAETDSELRNQTIDTLYKPLAELFGLQPRPQYGEDAWSLMEIAHSAVIEGLAMRSALDASKYFDELRHVDESDGESNWSLYALLFERFAEVFFEFPESAAC